MRIGLTTPVVTANPGAHSAWEDTAGADELATIAELADRLDFDHLTCSEHVGVPEALAAERGCMYWDPAVTLAFLAAHTQQIRLVTQVLVLGYHHPLQIAKQYGTLDRISGGRVVLGVGVGSLEAEFDLLGASWRGRGAEADDSMRALKASWGQRVPEYHGSHHDFAGFVVEPHAPTSTVPLWVGGRTDRSLRRAIDLGDGWIPFGLGAQALKEMLAAHELPQGFEVVLAPGRQLDPLGDPDATRRRLERIRDAGATLINVTIAADDADHYTRQLDALAPMRDDLA